MGNMQIKKDDSDIYTLCGMQLREARILANCSLQDIADKLRIRKAYIEAIEEGNWQSVPSETYARGYIKIYCNLLQVDYWRLLETAEKNACNLNLEQSRQLSKASQGVAPKRWTLINSILVLAIALVALNLWLV